MPASEGSKAVLTTAGLAGGLPAVVLFVVLAEGPAYAYTDPGSGLLLWQGLMAALVGAGFYFRKFVFQWFPRKRSDDPKK